MLITIQYDYGSLKTLFCSSKFPMAREKITSKFIGNLSTRPQTGWPALSCSVVMLIALAFIMQ